LEEIRRHKEELSEYEFFERFEIKTQDLVFNDLKVP
jgi:hypothetical protein